jgi:hypothetical protein
MAQKNQDAVAGLDQLIADTLSRLANNPDYIALKAFQKARAEIVGIKPSQPAPTITAADEITQNLREIPSGDTGKRVSQLDGAAATLERAGHPLPVRSLMQGAVDAGAFIGGDNPLASFSSSLSKSDRFKSVRWKGKYAWWFADRPMPPAIKRIRASREAGETIQEAAE